VLDPALRPALIKIDVEGGELGVFRGARETLARHRPHVVFEHTKGGATHHDATPEEVWDVLAACGLRVFDLEGDGPLSRDAFADAFDLRARHNWLARP
jgi:hypothetical protein